MSWEEKRIRLDEYELIDNPLWWQKKGLMYTATGYGSKIPTTKMILWKGRKYRLYCCIYSNIGTCYIVSKGKKYVVLDY